MKNLITKITFISLLSLNVIGAQAQQFTLSGKLTGEPDAPVILGYTSNDGKSIKDSTILYNGTFTFKGNVNGGVLGYMYVSDKSSKSRIGDRGNSVQIFLEPGNITATGSFDNLPGLKFIGSRSQTEYEALADLFKPTDAEMDAIEKKWLSNQQELFRITRVDKYDKRLAAINSTMDSLNDILTANTKKIEKQFIAAHPNSYVSAYELNFFKTRWKISEVTAIYKSLSPDMQNSYYGKQVQNIIIGIESNSGGKVAKNFTSSDINGKNVSLADFKGRYVLLDFWGSWCGPCRESTPHVKDLFAKYNKAGLDVLAIAVDDTPTDWEEAIKKDGTGIWHNIMIEKGRYKAANDPTRIDETYNIHVYPTKILVGKDGIIVGRYDGTESTAALDKKLADLFKGSD